MKNPFIVAFSNWQLRSPFTSTFFFYSVAVSPAKRLINLEKFIFCACFSQFGRRSFCIRNRRIKNIVNFKIIAIASSPFCAHFARIGNGFQLECLCVCISVDFLSIDFFNSKLTSFSNSKNYTIEYDNAEIYTRLLKMCMLLA